MTEQTLECIAFLLVRDNEVLAEQRSPTKRVMPGALAIPGGHLEDGESPGDAVRREIAEELGITAGDLTYVCTLLHRSAEFRKLHYYAIVDWTGEMVSNEADALRWIPFDGLEQLDLIVDQVAVAEYLRVYRTTVPPAGHPAGNVTDSREPVER